MASSNSAQEAWISLKGDALWQYSTMGLIVEARMRALRLVRMIEKHILQLHGLFAVQWFLKSIVAHLVDRFPTTSLRVLALHFRISGP